MGVRKMSWLLCVMGLGGLVVAAPLARAQNAPKNIDISVGPLYQFTQSSSGNGVSVKTSTSGGFYGSFRRSYRPWLGYEISYQYSRFTEYYSKEVFGIQNNDHEFGFSYYAHGRSAFGFQPFFIGGFSLMDFAPSLNGGQRAPWQGRPGINFGAGFNHSLGAGPFGIRAEYRGVFYKTPDFGQANLTTNAWRVTSDPEVGLYYRF